MSFKNFDTRNYPVVSPEAGYGEWAETYESTVPDLLDISALEAIRSVPWTSTSRCLDLACGTGRTGRWLKKQGVATIDGLDLTPEMLEKAERHGTYRLLIRGCVEKISSDLDEYDLITMCLADEHLPTLSKVYQEARRVGRNNARFVVVGMHPFFFMDGMPTHFDDKEGKPKAIDTHVHLMSDHFSAATKAGWHLQEVIEGKVDDRWIALKPKWAKYVGRPVNYAYVWKA